MDANERDGAAVRFSPPLVYLIAVIVSGLLHHLVLPLPLRLALSARIGVAVTVVLLGFLMLANALGLFRRTGQNPAPWKSTPEILSSGVYRITRNPMYVGMALLQAGIGIAWANGWPIALLPPVLLAIYRIAIRHEEEYLERKFGDSYIEYKNSVRRWL